MREHVYYAGIILKNNYEKLGPAGAAGHGAAGRTGLSAGADARRPATPHPDTSRL